MAPERTQPQSRLDLILRGVAGAVLLSFGVRAAMPAPAGPAPEVRYRAVLRQIHAEVKELGPYPGEDFIRREFFVGEDDDDTNKDVHVTVLIQSSPSKEAMTIRVTDMVKDPGNPQARLAGTSKILLCLVAGNRLEIQSSDYQETDLEKLAPEILKAIRNKKKLLKLGTVHN